VKPDLCPRCGIDMSIWGRMHTCRPQATATGGHLANSSNSEVANADCMANSMANEPAKAPGLNRASPTYKYRNPTKRRAYMANYMRTYRKRSTARAAIAS
jgi:hypothetical protein